jgi:hypothetical protein
MACLQGRLLPPRTPHAVHLCLKRFILLNEYINFVTVRFRIFAPLTIGVQHGVSEWVEMAASRMPCGQATPESCFQGRSRTFRDVQGQVTTLSVNAEWRGQRVLGCYVATWVSHVYASERHSHVLALV